ncbi:helix-turn-helix transcriptional regulator [Pseudoalteromonas sp. JBTF-M23]|uniref:Helix-turn-helix transcriptional regulator n=1 Tax=Pseudoalteromonas caenipelagi TaxID=2726988 RepID=A0A849VBN2_9GAMM|nr:helix-turn-helix transcriptional regulator [Pseudoalteromonas caenipelagi]NOU50258.1 helix-turn-helix transcriptional regulator [Pseudoalteromonas caenipelagi]
MSLTEFGKTVRKARIDVGFTLKTMAEELKTSASFLSGLETGSKKISKEWVSKIEDFFHSQGKEVKNLSTLADVANENVPLSGLSQQQQMLVAGFANSSFTPEELKRFAEFLEKINTESKE